MTDHADSTNRRTPRPLRPDWRWMLILGALLIVGGLMAFLNPFAASLTAVAIAGGIFTLGGAIQMWIAFQDEGGGVGRGLSGLLGLLILAFGVSLIANPLMGIVSLTLLIAGFFIASGVLRIWLGLMMRHLPGWGWLVASGAVSLILGVLVIVALPSEPGSLLGLFLGVDLLSTGVGLTALSLKIRARR
ncbi:HdeD family acid-resistance protein [Citreicella sp. C3M06]|uniref:HdeD family acid-resistance protein n=1 Tax=Citreicella sp. C3M06 TaxID=2841564 RepID=UPI001C08080D|nr:HdeD family acid-resistance protein [Citreicella sp. C3M06]MBU2960572.1 HdeD family acid-resistance protein [Citreicella sp. C3M06]